MFTIVISLITLVILLIYYLSTYKFNYWKKKNVPHLKPTPLLGNYGDYILMKKMYGQVLQEICNSFPKEPYVGAYFGTEPTLIVQDPEVIKLITTKDFAYFNSREILKHTHKENFGNTIIMTGGDKWKILRQNMTPLFTIAKMKNMFHLIEKCAYEFEIMLDREFKNSNVHELRSLVARFTMDCICACGFGVDTNTMKESPNNVFSQLGNSLFEVSNIRALATVVRAIWPTIFYGVGLKLLPNSISGFFHKLLTGVFESRNYTATARNDFVDLILDWKKKDCLTAEGFKFLDQSGSKQVSLKVDDDLLVAQCIAFFGAGYETSATIMSYTLYELAKSPEKQQRAYEEVEAYLRKNSYKIAYECINEMPYLNACLEEALRMYPVLNVLTREVVEDYTMPSGLKLDKGVRIHLPIYHLHHNPKNFPEPEIYRPERFLPGEREKIKPYTYLPFGEGPRICIGMRFSKMQTLAGLIVFLKKYRVELAPGMSSTIDFEPRGGVTTSKGGINLKLFERDGWQQRLLAH